MLPAGCEPGFGWEWVDLGGYSRGTCTACTGNTYSSGGYFPAVQCAACLDGMVSIEDKTGCLPGELSAPAICCASHWGRLDRLGRLGRLGRLDKDSWQLDASLTCLPSADGTSVIFFPHPPQPRPARLLTTKITPLIHVEPRAVPHCVAPRCHCTVHFTDAVLPCCLQAVCPALSGTGITAPAPPAPATPSP